MMMSIVVDLAQSSEPAELSEHLSDHFKLGLAETATLWMSMLSERAEF